MKIIALDLLKLMIAHFKTKGTYLGVQKRGVNGGIINELHLFRFIWCADIKFISTIIQQ
jgi:hypothetical protein